MNYAMEFRAMKKNYGSVFNCVGPDLGLKDIALCYQLPQAFVLLASFFGVFTAVQDCTRIE